MSKKPPDRARVESELDVLIREAHAAMRDLRAVMKEARAAEVRIRDLVAEEVSKDVAAEVGRQLEEMGGKITRAMAAAVKKVDGEFQRLANIYIYGEERPKPGKPHLGDMLRHTRGGRPVFPLGMPRPKE